MRIQQVVANFTANGQVSPWLKLDYYEAPFDVGLLVAYGSGLAATITVDYILDAMQQDSQRPVFITQTTTTITVKDMGPPLPTAFGGGLGHCLAVGDMVELTGTPGGTVDGLYAVATVTSGTVYTLTSGTSQTLAGSNAVVVSGRTMAGAAADNILKLAPVTARATIGITTPIYALRMRVTAFTTGGLAALVTMQGGAFS